MTTYAPTPIDTQGIAIAADLEDLLERLAEHNHDIWSLGRIGDGWTYGPTRDDAQKTHPDLVPYADLTDGEKQYDRNSVRSTIQAILALGYTIHPPA